MRTWQDAAIIVAAWAVAAVLAWFGVRTAAAHWRGRGLFLTALGFFLTLSGVPQAGEPGADASVSAPPNSSISQNALQAGGLAHAPASSVHPPELSAPEKWKAFAEYWQSLNAISPAKKPARREPAATEGDPSMGQDDSQPRRVGFENRSYYRAISPAKARELLLQLCAIMDLPVALPEAPKDREDEGFSSTSQLWDAARILHDAAAKKGLSPMAIAMTELATMRVVQMAAPLHQSALMRMAHFGREAEFERIDAVDRLEDRLDTLMALRARKAVSEDLFAATLGRIQADAENALVLSAICQGGFAYAPIRQAPIRLVASWSDAEKWEVAFSAYAETSCGALRDAVNKEAQASAEAGKQPATQASRPVVSPKTPAQRNLEEYDSRIVATQAAIKAVAGHRAAIVSIIRELETAQP